MKCHVGDFHYSKDDTTFDTLRRAENGRDFVSKLLDLMDFEGITFAQGILFNKCNECIQYLAIIKKYAMSKMTSKNYLIRDHVNCTAQKYKCIAKIFTSYKYNKVYDIYKVSSIPLLRTCRM